jgi:quinohemoprotein amine dehydrogenase
MTHMRRWLAAGILLTPVLTLLAAVEPPLQAPLQNTTPQAAAPAPTNDAQPSPPQGRGGANANARTEEGIPVTSAEVYAACGSCHARDDKNRMTRISYRRASPENWELTIRRMVALNNVNLTPEVARRIIKYLSDSHGLAPEEARPMQFEAERRLIDYTYTADRATANLCNQCHSVGRVLGERRTRDEWAGLMEMHRYYYPEAGAFRTGRGSGGGDGDSGGGQGRGGQPQAGPAGGGGGGGRGGNQQLTTAQNHLAQAFPLITPEWASWSAAMRTPRLAGRWALSGYAIGKGPIYGQVTISAQPGVTDGFLTEGQFVYARSGQTVARKSRAIVYTGFQWRGRSADGPNDPGTWKEVAFIERTGQQITGRWYTGAYDETGIDVTLRRVANDPVVMGTDVSALNKGSSTQRIRIYGANFPQNVTADAIDFGQGVNVSRVVSATSDLVTVDVNVGTDARVGPRDVTLATSTRPAALVVYEKIDGVKVRPQAGMARVGGVAFPPRTEQFEARAFSNGPDGKPETADDFDLGVVEPRWSLEEYTATFKDDDLKFVGELSAAGLFRPNADGPNPNRSGNRNNVGDVWVVATYTPEGADASVKPLRGRAHLLVTVPVYMDWGPREVGR